MLYFRELGLVALAGLEPATAAVNKKPGFRLNASQIAGDYADRQAKRGGKKAILKSEDEAGSFQQSFQVFRPAEIFFP